jgi:hypothetical protein
MHSAESIHSLDLKVVDHANDVLGPIFSQPWWLDAVAPGAWGEVKVEKDGQCVARMPFVTMKKGRCVHLGMPQLTQTLGPSLRYSSIKYAHRLSEEKELLNHLIDQLPSFHTFDQNFHHSITNWLPFYWQGFSQTTRYSYIIPHLDALGDTWEDMRPNIRREIRKAEKQLVVRDDRGVDAFLDLNELVFRRQGRELPYSRDLVARIDDSCGARQCRRIFFAEDAKGQRHAALYLIWNCQTAYYLMGGSDPELRHSGANSLLMWEAIKFASTVTNIFDFEGSMLEPVERFFRAFGARQIPYFRVTKLNSPALTPTGRVRAALRILRGRK